ncbi:MAG: hypothetical protein K0Q50_221 [Vampirovibrio sp.]|jgi:hypothetical protein|nr:hypothetical protein [Vampirovibrio sp.]
MARTRDLRPGFFKNEDLAECQPLTRLLFAGLWTIADREGRLQDRPKRIKTEILPYDECDIDQLLNELERFGFIVRYEIEGNRFIEITRFLENQRIHPKEPPSVIPEPTAESRGKTAANRTIPSFPTIPTLPTSPLTPKGEEEGFQQFWNEYPKKTTKKESSDYWRKNKLDAKLPEILNGLAAWKTSSQWVKDAGQYVPDAIRFLKKERWMDEVPPTISKPISQLRGSQIPAAGIPQAHERVERSGKIL